MDVSRRWTLVSAHSRSLPLHSIWHRLGTWAVTELAGLRMFRRCLITLLLLSYASNQLAALPHAHASEPAGHATRPHVHSGLLWEFVTKGTHNHHDHHRHDDGHHHTHGKPKPTSTPALPTEQGHDDDCVYLPDLTLLLRTGTPTDSFTPFGDLVPAPLIPSISPADPARLLAWSHWTTPPDRLASGSALYLTLRTLRI